MAIGGALPRPAMVPSSASYSTTLHDWVEESTPATSMIVLSHGYGRLPGPVGLTRCRGSRLRSGIVQSARIPVLVVVLRHRDLDVLGPDTDPGQPGHDTPVQLALQLHRVPAHHEHLDDDEAAPVHAAVAGIE